MGTIVVCELNIPQCPSTWKAVVYNFWLSKTRKYHIYFTLKFSRIGNKKIPKNIFKSFKNWNYQEDFWNYSLDLTGINRYVHVLSLLLAATDLNISVRTFLQPFESAGPP